MRSLVSSPYFTSEAQVPEERRGELFSWRTLLSADRTPTEGITMGTAEIPPGAPTAGARHRHPVAEVYYITAGTGLVHIDDQAHAVEAGTTLFIPSNAWHYVTNVGTDPLRVLYVFPVDSFDDVVYEYAERTEGPDA